MTNEEKAKAYDEALERAKAYHRNELAGSRKEMTEYIFPELRESEDERMMRVIGLALTDVPEERFTSLGITLKDCLAYLEKQKDAFENGRQLGIMQEQARQELEWDEQKEQKPANLLNTMMLSKDPHLLKQAAKYEQKPVECIEFDNEFKNQVSHLLVSVLNKEWEYDKEFVEYATQQLLGYAKHEIQSAEWSEEDADILNCCISSIEEAKENRYAYKETDGDTSYDREIDWLKSLRPTTKK